ncbi:lysosomal protective protein-like [Planoprotostelium fungivorum]|uniref:Carboxypeptidase n=1 Tax=Planoprotostelium fungivorum TaxID=1890364 RepID=A0A2P6N0X9_9EUKA|nr:lysosomal protective protein-like [Planoprotostelium fungivorum]
MQRHALLALLLVFQVLAAPQSDLITSLPGAPSGGYSFKQYSGYLDVGDSSHYHYWFVEAKTNPTAAPLILWLNGGPGCSSMDGLLEENGPFSVAENGTLLTNPFSWNTLANIIYLESPAGVGYSYNDDDQGYDDRLTASENYQALVAWFKKFPEYAKNPFYIMGESYGGHYVPMLSQLIVKATASNPNDAPQSNFKGFAAGNPLTDADYDQGDYWINQYLKYHGMIQLDDDDSTSAQGPYDPYDILVDVCPDGSSLSLSDRIRFPHRLNGYKGIDRKGFNPLKQLRVNNKRYVANPPACADDWTTTWANQDGVKSALHVNSDINWQICGGPSYTFGDESMLPIYKNILSTNKYKVLVYSGDEDTVLNFLATERWVLDLKYPIKTQWKPWYYDQGYGSQVGGYNIAFNAGAAFNFTTIKGSGHMVPWFQPALALQLLNNFLFH